MRRGTPEYRAWCGMKERCYRTNIKNYADYGGRGISVCERWRNSFDDFLADVGRRPSPQHSIDRIDNDGNYEPGNVRWAVSIEQNNNRRSSRWVTALGKTLTVAQWSRETGVKHGTIWQRIKDGHDPDIAVQAENIHRRKPRPCKWCGEMFAPKRTDSKVCSSACQNWLRSDTSTKYQAAVRARR